MNNTKCAATDCKNIATHTHGGHPTCNGCGTITRYVNAHLDIEMPTDEIKQNENKNIFKTEI